MNFDHQKFFIGLMDVFSILLPGALLSYLLMGEVRPVVPGDRYANLDGAQAWTAFLFASYLFGHLVFLLGLWLDEFYNWSRCHKLNTQITLLAHRGRLLPRFVGALILQVFTTGQIFAKNWLGEVVVECHGTFKVGTPYRNMATGPPNLRCANDIGGASM